MTHADVGFWLFSLLTGSIILNVVLLLVCGWLREDRNVEKAVKNSYLAKWMGLRHALYEVWLALRVARNYDEHKEWDIESILVKINMVRGLDLERWCGRLQEEQESLWGLKPKDE